MLAGPELENIHDWDHGGHYNVPGVGVMGAAYG